MPFFAALCLMDECHSCCLCKLTLEIWGKKVDKCVMSAKQIMDSWLSGLFLYYFGVTSFVLHVLLIWPLAGVDTDRVAWLGRVLTVDHACCTEIRNTIDSTEKIEQKGSNISSCWKCCDSRESVDVHMELCVFLFRREQWKDTRSTKNEQLFHYATRLTTITN